MEYNFTYREKDKGFQVILSYKDNMGRWKQKSKQGFSTKRDAKKAGDKLLDEVKTNMPLYMDDSTKDITFGEFASMYLHDVRRKLAYNTIANYEKAINAFSDLKDMQLIGIKHSDIFAIFNALPYKASTANLYLAIIKTIFKQAVSPYRLIVENPALEIKPFKIKGKKKTNALTKDALENLLKSMKKRNLTAYMVCCIAAFAGLRIGEIQGLKWSDINFSADTITVERQLVYTAQNVKELKTLKTNNSYRTVPMPKRLRAVLLEYKQHAILQIDGTILPRGCKDTAKTMLRQYGKISPHDFRHTYATTLLSNGFDVKTVAALLGDTVETVLKAYVHFTDDMRDSAQKRLSNFF